jgi:hypothetical protein
MHRCISEHVFPWCCTHRSSLSHLADSSSCRSARRREEMGVCSSSAGVGERRSRIISEPIIETDERCTRRKTSGNRRTPSASASATPRSSVFMNPRRSREETWKLTPVDTGGQKLLVDDASPFLRPINSPLEQIAEQYFDSRRHARAASATAVLASASPAEETLRLEAID